MVKVVETKEVGWSVILGVLIVVVYIEPFRYLIAISDHPDQLMQAYLNPEITVV